MTRSLQVALADLGLDRAWIVYPGTERYPVHERVEVLPLREIRLRLPFAARVPKAAGGRG